MAARDDDTRAADQFEKRLLLHVSAGNRVSDLPRYVRNQVEQRTIVTSSNTDRTLQLRGWHQAEYFTDVGRWNRHAKLDHLYTAGFSNQDDLIHYARQRPDRKRTRLNRKSVV